MKAMPTRGTKQRSVRVPDHLWDAAQQVAEGRGEDLSAVIRQALERYVQRAAREANH